MNMNDCTEFLIFNSLSSENIKKKCDSLITFLQLISLQDSLQSTDLKFKKFPLQNPEKTEPYPYKL